MTRIKSTSLYEGADMDITSESIATSGVELAEEVIFLNRVAKVVKGGRHFSFCALVAVGDKKGMVGVGYGKANQVPDAIRKAVDDAKKNVFRIPFSGRTIPHEVTGIYGAARVMLKPASEGTGIIAGPAARAVITLAGLKDILTKCLGTDTALNVVKATVAGLRSLQDPQRISERRGKSVEYLLGKKFAEKYNQTRSEMLAAMGQTQADEQNKPALDAADAAEEAEAHEKDGEPDDEGRPSTKRGHRKTSHSSGAHQN